MTLTPLLIVGLLAVPATHTDRPQGSHPQTLLHSVRPIFTSDLFSDSRRPERLKLDFRPAPGSFSKFTRDRSVDQAPSRAAFQTRKRSTARKIVGAAVGAFGGFFLGGYAGAAIEGDRCNCDDPGLQGFLIGAPIGAVAGGIFGTWISGK
jgi:hypothetical protein